MRIAVVSDIHGNLPALQAVVRDFQRRGVDTVFNLGDSLSGPLLPLQTAQFLMAQDWLHLAGNHERQVLTQGPGQWSAADAYAHAQLGEREFAWMASLGPAWPTTTTSTCATPRRRATSSTSSRPWSPAGCAWPRRRSCSRAWPAWRQAWCCAATRTARA